MFKKWAVILLSLFFCFNPAFGKDIPNPTGWVNDFAGVINSEYK